MSFLSRPYPNVQMLPSPTVGDNSGRRDMPRVDYADKAAHGVRAIAVGHAIAGEGLSALYVVRRKWSLGSGHAMTPKDLSRTHCGFYL